MAHFRADHAPAWAPGGLHWPDRESVVEVTDPGLVNDLAAIHGFREVPAPAPEAEDKPARKPRAAQA